MPIQRILAMLKLGALAAVIAVSVLWPRPEHVAANPLSGVAGVATGLSHTCALTTAGGVKCWGANFSGQLGNGTASGFDPNPTPVDVVGLSSGVAAIAAGNGHTCALTTAGGLKCWGGNKFGQLGNGTFSGNPNPTPVDVVGLSSGVAAVAAGADHTCALTTAGGLKCWGRNQYGQLGDGTDGGGNQSTSPVDVVGLSSGVAAVATSGWHTCAVTTAGGLKCWGHNRFGQLGDGTTAFSQPIPVDVSGLTSGVAAAAGGSHRTCALTTANGVKCWGFNAVGSLGDGTTTDRTTPVDVVGLASGVAAIASRCALTDAGGVKCWGGNFYGQLGDGTTSGSDPNPIPVDVVGLSSGATAIAAGNSHTCAVTTAGGLKCWGHNTSGELGDGTTTNRTNPVAVVVLGPKATPTPFDFNGTPVAVGGFQTTLEGDSASGNNAGALAATVIAVLAAAIALVFAAWYAKRWLVKR